MKESKIVRKKRRKKGRKRERKERRREGRKGERKNKNQWKNQRNNQRNKQRINAMTSTNFSSLTQWTHTRYTVSLSLTMCVGRACHSNECALVYSKFEVNNYIVNLTSIIDFNSIYWVIVSSKTSLCIGMCW